MMSEESKRIVAEWMGGAECTLEQVKETLVRLGYSVQVIYEPRGITVGIVRAGRGQLNSGMVEEEALYGLMARMIEDAALPATTALPQPVEEVMSDAGKEVPINQAAEGLRGAEEEGIPEIEGGSDLEQHGKAKKAKKVA